MRMLSCLALGLLFFLTGAGSAPQNDPPKMKLIYLYDALCGWCYGFSPVMQRFAAEHADELTFEVISGGMITGPRIGPIGEVAPYISWAYKEVEQKTGVTFGEGFLQGILAEGKAIFSSVPPAVVLSVFKAERPGDAVAFAGRLQRAVYHDGIEPEDTAAYGALAAEFGLDSAAFVALMGEARFQQAAQQDFAYSQALGVTGFPTVVLAAESGGEEKLVLLGQGYLPYEALLARYAKAKGLVGQKAGE